MNGDPIERLRAKAAAYDARRKASPPAAGATPPQRAADKTPHILDGVNPERRMDMRLSPVTAAHEAAHAMIAGALMIPATVIVNEDGSGQCRYSIPPATKREAALLAVAGAVGEALVFNGGDLRRAIRDCLDTERDGDGKALREAMADVPGWRQGDFVADVAGKVRACLSDPHNRPQFDKLRALLAQGYRFETVPETVPE